MRWFRLREARIDPALRETFEQYGVGSMQTILATAGHFRHQGGSNIVHVEAVLGHLLPWLTEQYDRVERKETWALTMDAAITLFVAAELVLRFVG